MCQDDEDKEVSVKVFDVVRSEVFNFHSVNSGIIVKLKTKSSQKTTDTYKYKTDRPQWQFDAHQNVQNALSAYKPKWAKQIH